MLGAKTQYNLHIIDYLVVPLHSHSILCNHKGSKLYKHKRITLQTSHTQ